MTDRWQVIDDLKILDSDDTPVITPHQPDSWQRTGYIRLTCILTVLTLQRWHKPDGWQKSGYSRLASILTALTLQCWHHQDGWQKTVYSRLTLILTVLKFSDNTHKLADIRQIIADACILTVRTLQWWHQPDGWHKTGYSRIMCILTVLTLKWWHQQDGWQKKGYSRLACVSWQCWHKSDNTTKILTEDRL